MRSKRETRIADLHIQVQKDHTVPSKANLKTSGRAVDMGEKDSYSRDLSARFRGKSVFVNDIIL